VKTLSTTEIKRLNRAWRRRSEGRLALTLVSLSNPFNVGSIMRSAAVFGVETVWLVGATPGPADAKVKKTGLGTESGIPTPRVDTVAEAAAAARAAGFRVVALELASDAQPIASYEFSGPTCLVIGNEGHGLPPSALAACDVAVYVPQPGRVASLNVATATSIALYEVRRQGWAAQPTGMST
jgi:tRNA (guanosine-2'-O-)-methyltransferase